MVEGEYSHDGGADDTAIWDGAETVSGVVRVRAFAVVAGDEDFSLWDDGVYFAGGVFFGAPRVANAGGVVWVESVWKFFVKNGDSAIFDGDSFSRKGDNAFDDILVFDIRVGLAGEGAGGGAVGKDDDLAALRLVFLSPEVGDRYWDSVDNNAVITMQGVFHTDADDIVRAEDEGI